MTFQPSINIMYDLGKVELFENYVPNINQIEIMDSILLGINNSEQHTHLLIGPYGAGKSLIGAITTTLVTNSKVTKKTYAKFFKSLSIVRPNVEQNIRETIIQKSIKWIPVMITGKSGDFEQIIINSIQKKLEEEKIPFTFKTDGNYIKNLILNWEKNHENVYQQLIRILKKNKIVPKEFFESIKTDDENAIIFFKNIYPEIAFGMVFHNPDRISFVEQLEFVFKVLAKKKIGLFIVFDEFGRFLQTLSNSEIHKNMQHIQDAAELINRQKNAFLLMITHTGLQQYVTNDSALTKKELERVEKRFTEHHLSSDSTVFYRLAHQILNNKENQHSDMFFTSDFIELNQFILRYNLFPEMNLDEITGFILEGCQPLHPLTVQILPNISNILGQNDRTLYMFLNQFNPDEFKTGWYHADRLFDYFYPDENILYTLDTMKYYRLAINYKVSSNALRLVKLGTIINLLNNRYPLTENFICFALGLELDEVEKVMNELLNMKLLRFNPFIEAYELYEGSLVDFENLKNSIQDKIIINDELRIETIHEVFDEKYYLPLGYNTAKSMTRYIEAKFAFVDQPFEFNSTSDGVILYVLIASDSEREKIKEKLNKMKNKDVLVVTVELEIDRLREYTNQYIVLSRLLEMPDIINEDLNLKKEILIRMDAITFHLQKILKPIKNWNIEYLSFYRKGKIVIENRRTFDHYIDQWMFEKFPLTPEVRNESFNKHKVMKIQKKSAIRLLNQILSPNFKGDFEINGFGPDYLIFATVFKKLNFNFGNLDEQKNRELTELRKKILEHLEVNNKNSIYGLFDIALQEPFGIREPLVPLLVIALIKDRWNQMAFYSNGFSIIDMSSEMLYEILEQKVEFYEYEIYILDDGMQELLNSINSVFFDEAIEVHPNFIFKKLNSWLFGLPRFAQITNKQPNTIMSFKEIIRASETDPLTATKKLYDMNLSKDNLYEFKKFLEGFCLDYRKSILKRTLDLFEVNSISEITHKHPELIQNSPQLKEIVKVFNQTKEIDSVILKVVGIRFEQWSDITYDSYFATLNQLMLVSDSESIKIVDGNQVVTTIKEMELSVKGNTIYKQLQRIVTAGGRTMNSDEVKFILYKILQESK